MAIITFKDADGVEQTLDTEQKFNAAFHADCMEILHAMPDRCIDLIVADPPYGGGFTENGGCQGWFSKYHQDSTEHRNLRGRFDKYNDRSQTVNVERERENRRDGSSDSTAAERRTRGKSTSATIARTGGTWAEKYGKKS